MKPWPTGIVTGGCSGLGLGLAELLLQRGGLVGVRDREIGDDARER